MYTLKSKKIIGLTLIWLLIFFVSIKGAHVGYDDEDDITFTIKVDDKTFHLQARNLDEREKWVSKIEELIELHSNFNLFKDNVRFCGHHTWIIYFYFWFNLGFMDNARHTTIWSKFKRIWFLFTIINWWS